MFAPQWSDAVLLVALAALATTEVLLFHRLSRDPSRTTKSTFRVRIYIFFIVYQWLLAAAIFVAWTIDARPWSTLLLGTTHPIGFTICIGLAAAYGSFAFLQIERLNDPKIAVKARKQFAEFEWLAPHSIAERRLWILAAITAGCCEELFFRGFLFALATLYMPVVATVLTTSILFGLYHAYYGPAGIAKTGAVGLVLSLVALISGSLLPAMLLHALIDSINGDAGYRVASAGEIPLVES